MLDVRPNLITIIIEFSQDCKPAAKAAVRRSFLGERKGAANIPKEMMQLLNSDDELIIPEHYAYIKKPIMIELPTKKKYKVSNKSVGLIVIYEYLGLFQKLENFFLEFNKYLNNLFKENQNIQEKLQEKFYIKRFEKVTGKNAIWKGKKTKQFLRWKDKPNEYPNYCNSYQIIIGKDLQDLFQS